MKKLAGLICLLFMFTAAAPITVPEPPLEMSREGRSTLSPRQRVGHVMKRGVLNLGAGLLIVPETMRTLKEEREVYPKLWLVTGAPRSFHNVAIRLFSGAFDAVVYPFVAPFTDDIRPLTQTYDLPEYPWTEEE